MCYNVCTKENFMDIENLVKVLTEKGLHIATMESCTGGGLANAITNVAGSSDVFEFGAVTYSNAYKVKMGVPQKIIDEFSVYSSQTAQAMARAVAEFTNADYGVGITGKLKRADKKNLFNNDDLVYVCVYDKNNDKILERSLNVTFDTRKENKQVVIDTVVQMFELILQ